MSDRPNNPFASQPTKVVKIRKNINPSPRNRTSVSFPKTVLIIFSGWYGLGTKGNTTLSTHPITVQINQMVIATGAITTIPVRKLFLKAGKIRLRVGLDGGELNGSSMTTVPWGANTQGFWKIQLEL